MKVKSKEHFETNACFICWRKAGLFDRTHFDKAGSAWVVLLHRKLIQTVLYEDDLIKTVLYEHGLAGTP